MPGEENCLVPMKTPPEEFLPLHPRLHAKGLGALLEEVKAKLLQSSVTTPRSEQKLTGNVMPRVCEEHKVEETRGSCLVQSGEVKPEKPVGGRHRSGKESLEKTGERRNQELSSDFSTGETCEMGNLSGCCMETRQKTQNERRRSLEEVRRNMCIFTETKGNNRGHQESDEVASGRRERNGENDDVKERQGCPEQDQVGGDVEKHSYVLPEEFLQALLPTRYSFLQSVSSLESYFCQHVYGLLSRCRALPGEAHEKVGKTKERRKEEVTPKPAAERERREERTPSHQNHDSLDKEEERKDKQEERDYKERNKPPQFKGAIRATRHLLETDAWKRAKVVWVDLDFPSLQWLLSEEATQDKIFLTPPPPTTEPFLLTRLPTVYTLGDVPTSQSFDGKGVQTEDMKKKKTELEKSSSLSSCNCNNPGGVHKAGTEITKTEGSHGETQATTAPLIEETTFDGDEYENREKKRTREACGTSDSSDGRTGESTSVVTKEGEVAYVVWKFSRQHKAHVVVLQQGDAESASRESFGGLSVDIVLASCSAVTPEGCIFGTRPSYFETDPSQRPTVMTIAHDLQILEGFTPVVTHTSPRPNAVYDFASSVPFVASSSAGEAGEQRDASSALRDAPAGVKSLSTSAPLAPCRNGVPESEIAPFCTFNCQAMSLLSEGARVINLAVSRSRAFQSLSGNSVIPQKRRKEPGPATERGMSRLAHFIATPSRSWSVYGREVDIS
ncbi:hypothetical protein CSUI_005936 [Cystoisospora suis]|uniref:Uncharacterized protein n=1 Tax=Cystoisospora suis TaxID=483139 RepID=A0A2C6KVB5_9APIC|nr:hypothetical protein CSUI_005936 [Cystoisospora suis]